MTVWNPSKVGAVPKRRRSQRVILTLAVKVRTEPGQENSFEETTQTLLVNAHGALIALANKVLNGQKLLITNCATHVERACTVAHVGALSAGKTQIGVEFTVPAPDFWRIAFPPEDWVVPEPESVIPKTK